MSLHTRLHALANLRPHLKNELNKYTHDVFVLRMHAGCRSMREVCISPFAFSALISALCLQHLDFPKSKTKANLV